MNRQEEQHSISLLVSNRPGVLIRIAEVFARRGYNLDSVVVSPTHRPAFSRMNIVASGDREILAQVIRQLDKLVDVVHAADHTGEEIIEGEIAFFKVDCPVEKRTELMQLAEHFTARSVDLTADSITFEATGKSAKLNAFQLMLEQYGILESVRSGKLLMARGRSDT
ncbi:acetolactate synthase small subunit [Treponema zuelzerae]|uniref:Acetolactate synthase small subunit n=1 Tax=Teretinema zuelzerae TaxID=156 RepID=A0AAE3EJS7_9SPIR|nr:acetolactate synthase small subunit [Teretinema zuelzerae]MBN2810415.1 acetolactate synthase small subunit [Spirochaetales bacterium]MCD1655068.1 acetolactate synthase small subunit [Teretinema zuelzerae]HPO02851.1 acetolactate synthase small subunit [Treponemataceae bacterium]